MPQIKFRFPLLGVNKNFAASTRPDYTSSDMNNVRPFDVLEERARGGQRPGMRKVYNQDIGNGTPVVKIAQITTVEL
jgi:hypothetical protein